MSAVIESDRSVIKLLLGEANAEVEEIVQDITPDDLVSTVAALNLSSFGEQSLR